MAPTPNPLAKLLPQLATNLGANLPVSNFEPIGGGGTTGTGGSGGPVTNVPITVTPTSGTTGTTTPPATSTGLFGSALNYLFGGSLLRIAFFLLGLICIIGAIYLYKDTRFVIQAPLNAAKGAARTVAESGAAAAAAA